MAMRSATQVRDGVAVTGRLRDLPERGDPVVPGLVCGRGWVALMYARGRMDAGQVAAAVDIGRGLMVDAVVASGLRAVDPARLVVDGGNRTTPPDFPAGGWSRAGGSPSSRRVAEWRASCRRADRGGLLRGRRGSLWVDVAVVQVLMGDVSPSALDERLGLRKERVRDAVLVALSGYNNTFGLHVPKKSA